MKSEQAKKLADDALDTLADALAAGKSGTLHAVLQAAARFHRYSFRNIMLIATQRPDATHVAGFNAWKKLGRFVKKGEHGIVIVAPIPIRSDASEVAESGVTASESAGIRFKAAYVFDVAQTDGEPLPEHATVSGEPGQFTERLKSFIAGKGIVLEYLPDLGGPDGTSSGGKIQVRTGLTPAEEFSVLAHELGHELLHRDADRATTTKTQRETEAEAVAFVLTTAVGLDTSTAASDYIQLYNGDKDTLAASLGRIQHVAAEIIDALDLEEGV